jgi:hypothetical protein
MIKSRGGYIVEMFIIRFEKIYFPVPWRSEYVWQFCHLFCLGMRRGLSLWTKNIDYSYFKTLCLGHRSVRDADPVLISNGLAIAAVCPKTCLPCTVIVQNHWFVADTFLRYIGPNKTILHQCTWVPKSNTTVLFTPTIFVLFYVFVVYVAGAHTTYFIT